MLNWLKPQINGILFFALALIISVKTHASNPEQGNQLHQQNCTQCHTSEVYTRTQRLVNNLQELKLRVQQCEIAAELAWFEEEVDAVINYLNTNFYRFIED